MKGLVRNERDLQLHLRELSFRPGSVVAVPLPTRAGGFSHAEKSALTELGFSPVHTVLGETQIVMRERELHQLLGEGGGIEDDFIGGAGTATAGGQDSGGRMADGITAGGQDSGGRMADGTTAGGQDSDGRMADGTTSTAGGQDSGGRMADGQDSGGRDHVGRVAEAGVPDDDDARLVVVTVSLDSGEGVSVPRAKLENLLGAELCAVEDVGSASGDIRAASEMWNRWEESDVGIYEDPSGGQTTPRSRGEDPTHLFPTGPAQQRGRPVSQCSTPNNRDRAASSRSATPANGADLDPRQWVGAADLDTDLVREILSSAYIPLPKDARKSLRKAGRQTAKILFPETNSLGNESANSLGNVARSMALNLASPKQFTRLVKKFVAMNPLLRERLQTQKTLWLQDDQVPISSRQLRELKLTREQRRQADENVLTGDEDRKGAQLLLAVIVAEFMPEVRGHFQTVRSCNS